MKQLKSEYYVQVQRHKTIKYGEKQHHQDYITIPAQLSETLELQSGQIMKCVLNGNGNSLTYTKVTEKPSRMRYEEWLEKIKPHIPTTGPGKTYTQICKEAGLIMRAAPADWVHKAQFEIHLNQTKDKQTHHIFWTRTVLPDGKNQTQKETKPKELTLLEFQA